MHVALVMQETPSGIGEPAPPDAMSGLMRRIAEARDRDAFRDLFVHYAPRLKSFMLRKGADAELAEELMQETLLAVWSKARLYHPARGSVTTWVFTIARNLRIDRLRRQTVHRFDDIDEFEISEGEGLEAGTVIAQDEAVAPGGPSMRWRRCRRNRPRSSGSPSSTTCRSAKSPTGCTCRSAP
jgi:RNA polymerase sigma-70 factor (ECF subfamily)